MRAIDADKMKADLLTVDPQFETMIQWCITVLDAQPTIEFEIIHCKDCKHWSRESICDGFCSEDCMRHDEDFYCGYAERRPDGN